MAYVYHFCAFQDSHGSERLDILWENSNGLLGFEKGRVHILELTDGMRRSPGGEEGGDKRLQPKILSIYIAGNLDFVGLVNF